MTDPPKTSPSSSGVPALVTSIPSSIYWEIILKSVLLSSASVEAKRVPSTVIELYFGESPLITTLFPSPPSLLMVTPGTLATDSAALASGSSCIRSEDTTLTSDLAANCLFIASICPLACPVTTISSPSIDV